MDIALNLKHEEKDFITACIRKERWAQKKLYEDHYSQMMGVCLRYSNNKEDALDILHEGFIKVFKKHSKVPTRHQPFCLDSPNHGKYIY